ncbi:MAG: hypothetical protein A3G80_09440 [Betaproteobacteria bacterium RIFCSPLOWO2_12_FULL_62_13b]|nr:MAG: hypothetical protein A3G80_09440 [Betaproteobacteria bacterium RIFCSPLOWO2_12_FULL_62_13b]
MINQNTLQAFEIIPKKTDEAPKDPTVTFEDNYVEIRYPKAGVFTCKSIEETLHLAIDLCAMHRCRRILQKAEWPICHNEPRCIVDALGRVSTLPGLTFACCCDAHTASTADDESVPGSSGVRIRFFREREKALQWLGAK